MKDPNAPDRPATQEGAIKAIDDKIFIDQNTHLKTYQAFDHDKDGYVSANDIRNTLITKNWMEAPEREQFVSYVDPENKGTVDFRQFSSKVRRNMTNWDEKGGHKERNIMQPAKEHVEKRKNEADYMSKTFTNLRRTYLPDTSGSSISPYKEMEGKTRYGMTPVSKNTFTNFQVPEYSSPMYMPNIDRLKADNFSRTSYQRDDLVKKKTAESARIENRRAHSQQILKRIEDREKVQEIRYENRLHNKAACNMIYEHKTNLTNRLEFY